MNLLRSLSCLSVVVAAAFSIGCSSQTPAETNTGASSSSGDNPVDLEPMDEPAEPFALVEIFTSEG